MIDAWYLPAEEYYVSDQQAEAYPLRQGDVFGPLVVQGKQWAACQLLHPSCELAKSQVNQLQIIRVRLVSEVNDLHKAATICTGWQEKNGVIQVAFAHTFFLAPIAKLAENQPLFSDFRDLAVVRRDDLINSGRLVALTPEARVTFIRRLLYFRFRYSLSYRDVLELEKARIAHDHVYEGPRPAWALEADDESQ